jgi:Transposase DDE domain
MARACASSFSPGARTGRLGVAHDCSTKQSNTSETGLQTICFATQDAMEGRTAFKEKTCASVPPTIGGLAARRGGQPTGAVIDGLTLRSTARSARAAYDRAKRNKGSKLHLAVDALAHLLALHVTPANGGDAPAPIADVVQVKTGESARSPPSIRLYGRQATGCGGRTRRRSRGRKLSAATLA